MSGFGAVCGRAAGGIERVPAACREESSYVSNPSVHTGFPEQNFKTYYSGQAEVLQPHLCFYRRAVRGGPNPRRPGAARIRRVSSQRLDRKPAASACRRNRARTVELRRFYPDQTTRAAARAAALRCASVLAASVNMSVVQKRSGDVYLERPACRAYTMTTRASTAQLAPPTGPAMNGFISRDWICGKSPASCETLRSVSLSLSTSTGSCPL